MHEAIEFLVEQGYIVLFIWVLLEQVGFPVPVVPILLGAGALAGLEKLDLPLVFVLALAASLTSDQFLYQMGRRRGGKVLSFLCRISLDPDSCVRRTKEIFARFGAGSLLFAKFIPGMNTVAPPLAGISRMPLPRFLVFDCLGAFIWVGLFVLLGYQFGKELEDFVTSDSVGGPWVGLIVPTSLAIYVIWKYVRRKRFLRQLSIARVTPEEVKQRLDAGEELLILDMRDAFEFETDPHTIPGAIQIPLEQLSESHDKIPRNRDVVLYCS